MSLEKELGNRKDFKQHLALFIVVHIIVNFWLRMDTPFLSGLKESILEGKIWYYHEESEIFVTMIWLIIIVVQGVYVFFRGNDANKE
ncbi:hypothetical protein BBD41_23630 [Paenibacillus ihbetae]|uniref:2TM domain-containing protein n=1 Tax=Paenibacillus ihbetae TaxID=1870820 RepID=A0A1B2E5S6_9BACL|nr:2TM domain-containing protein [Paenibacillus ihbetae]ANY75324.1 hypothetical protein BBD41_23630 [Paenibacillus ihbetae]